MFSGWTAGLSVQSLAVGGWGRGLEGSSWDRGRRGALPSLTRAAGQTAARPGFGAGGGRASEARSLGSRSWICRPLPWAFGPMVYPSSASALGLLAGRDELPPVPVELTDGLQNRKRKVDVQKQRSRRPRGAVLRGFARSQDRGIGTPLLYPVVGERNCPLHPKETGSGPLRRHLLYLLEQAVKERTICFFD